MLRRYRYGGSRVPGQGRTPALPVGGADSEDARFAITTFAAAIGNADTKSGFLIAGLSLLVGAIAARRDAALALLPPPDARGAVAVTALTGTLLLALGAAGFLVRALRPRTHDPGFSRYSWPSVAAAGQPVLERLEPENERREAWLEAQTLAVIARGMFRDVARAQ